MKKKVLITGATGFIGANLARRLLAEKMDVHLLLRPQHQSWRIDDIKKKSHLHLIDVSNSDKVLRLFKKIKPQWIFHLSAYGAYSSQNDINQIASTNIIGANNLFESALRSDFEALINVGSSSEYGFKDHAPSETEWLEPNSHYALSKAYATMLGRHLAIKHKKNIVTLRPYSVYGPWEEPTRFIPTLLIHAFNNKLPPLVSPTVARDYIFVDDFLDACLIAAKKQKEPGAIYNVGTGIQTTIKEAVDLTNKIFSIKAKPQWGSMDNRRWDTNVWVADNRLIKKSLGWRPQHTFEAGFKKTINWFKENPQLLKSYSKQILKK